MNDFAHVLRRAEGQLRAPEPQRSRILLEMAQDLDDLYLAYRQRGYPEAEARRRAEEALGASRESLQTLDGLHTSAAARLLRRFTDRHAHRGERTLLTLLGLFALVAGGHSLLTAGLARAPSPYLWPLLLLVAISILATARLALSLYLARERLAGADDLLPLPGFAGLIATAGILATVLEGWRVLARIGAGGAASAAVAVEYLVAAASLLTLAFTHALALLLIWFHLRRRAMEVAAIRAALVRLDYTPTGGEE